MASKSMDSYKVANTTIIPGNSKKSITAIITAHTSRIKNFVKRIHPFNWFDGFLDDLEIELKELS